MNLFRKTQAKRRAEESPATTTASATTEMSPTTEQTYTELTSHSAVEVTTSNDTRFAFVDSSGTEAVTLRMDPFLIAVSVYLAFY